jgi:hypothetical protein
MAVDYDDLLDFVRDNDLGERQTIKTLLDLAEDSESGEDDEEED